jgi:GTP diphosphokinase / guanosine-3',5'-bis(diphosphate) 3'-diphosphatase
MTASTLDDLVAKLQTYLSPADVEMARRAYAFSAQAHAGQLRASGEDYVTHPLAAAITLAEMGLDAQAIAAALLHDVPEDTTVPLEKVEAEFGPEVAHLVDGVTKLSKIEWGTLEERQAESLRKMFLAMAEDMRVVLIKLADRLHNLSTLDYLRPDKRLKIARETLEIYAPLASRLGIWNVKWRLEDLAFRHLNPQKYREIARLLANQRQGRERYLDDAIAVLKEALSKAGIEAELYGRAKHIYSIYRKMERKHSGFDQIYDLLAVRVMVKELAECYGALGVVHSLWHPIPGEFDDYIAVPKENLYRSLHTAVVGPQGQPLEVQIRTTDMHRVAEYGVAAHWRYKEGTSRHDANFESKVAWLRQLMEWRKEIVNAKDFVESFRTDIFQDQVYVFTPKNDIIDLPAGSTPVDFAFRIHTDIGYRCRGARVNGRLVGLDYRLQNGDRVEVTVVKGGGPSRDWLNPNLGFVASSHAREKIRAWFKKQARSENVSHGKDELEKELKTMRLESEFERVIRIFEDIRPAAGDSVEKAQARWQEELKAAGYGQKQTADIIGFFQQFGSRDELYLAIGTGDNHAGQISSRLLHVAEGPEEPLFPQVAARAESTGIQVMGESDLLTQLARCCNPVPGDEIVGYVTRGRGITVHRKDCRNVARIPDPERLVAVDWGRAKEHSYPVPIRIEAADREGLLRDVAALVAEEKINVAAASVETNRKDRSAVIRVTLEVTDVKQLSRILAKIENKIKEVRSVRRDTSSL